MWAGAFYSSVRADDAMSWNQQIERRFSHRRRDPAMRERRADRASDVGVRNEFACFEL